MRKLFLLFLFAPTIAFGAPSYNSDAQLTTIYAPGIAPATISFTEASGSNNELIAMISTESPVTWTATYNLSSMTAVRNDNSSSEVYSHLFHLDNASAGTHNLVILATGGFYASPVGILLASWANASGVANNSGVTLFNSGTPWIIPFTVQASVTTSTLFIGADQETGCGGTPSWGLTTNLGTERFVGNTNLNSNVGNGFIDYAPASTASKNVTLTFANAGCLSSGNALAQSVEILGIANTPTPTHTPVPPTPTPTHTPVPPTPTPTHTPVPPTPTPTQTPVPPTPTPAPSSPNSWWWN